MVSPIINIIRYYKHQSSFGRQRIVPLYVFFWIFFFDNLKKQIFYRIEMKSKRLEKFLLIIAMFYAIIKKNGEFFYG